MAILMVSANVARPVAKRPIATRGRRTARTLLRITGRRLLLAVLCLTTPASSAHAVDLRDVLTGYTFTSWSRKDGLVGPVWAIAQDANGFLWLGTDSALVRFDGVRFVTWEGLGGQPLPRLPVRALSVTPSGTLWVGFGGSGGLARIDNRAVTSFVDASSPDFSGPVTSIIESPTGVVWVSATTGLHRFANSRWDRIGANDGLSGDGPVNGFVDTDGGLWASTPDGLFRRESADEGAFTLVERTADPLRTISLSQDRRGRVWATDGFVGFRALGAGPVYRGHDAGRGYRLLHDRVGQLWVATIGQGLWRVDDSVLTRGTPTVERATVLTGLSSDAVRTVFEDRDGNIWAGTTDGVDRLGPHRVTPFTGLGVVNTLDTTTDERVWVGTADGLVAFARDTRGWQVADARIPVRGATAVRGSKAGGLWVSTATALYRVLGNVATQVTPPHEGKPFTIEAIATDDTGEAWVVSSGGEISKTEGGQLRSALRLEELAEVRTNAALLDRNGQLWVLYGGTTVGVVGKDGRFRTYGDAGLGTSAHYDIFEDDAGTIWTCGAEGLSRLSGDRFVKIGVANGLPTGGVYSIAQDDRHDLWLATSSGILRLDPAEFDRALASHPYVVRFRIYDTSDGLAGYPVTLGDRNAVRAADGTLWFVTSRGISVADPRSLSLRRPATLVAIDAVRADDVSVTTNELLPGTSKLEIDYTAPELTSPLKTRFRYRLDGYDTDWIDAGTRRQALYAGLAPGTYTFRVAVSQDDGRWSENEATWSFTEHPRFRQTWWFYGLIALGLTGVTLGAWQIRVRQLRRQFALVLGERVRLSRELHDTLLQSLVGVALEFDVVSKSLESSPAAARDRVIKIREQVEEYIREARRSIWSLRSPALETGDLVDALRESGTRATAGQTVAFSFEQTGRPRRLSSNIEHQLLRIGQEAVLNAVRHSGGSSVAMRLHYDEDAVTLTIADNGRGFDAGVPAEGTGDHYGLITMRERAQQAGGHLEFSSTPGGGTTIVASAPARFDTDASRDDE